MSAASPVTIAIVTHNAAAELVDCLESVAALDHPELEVVVVDCASDDGTPERTRVAAERVRRSGLTISVLPLGHNVGFAGGMNVAIAASSAPWVLSLNADARPRPTFLARLLAAASGRPRVGAVTGRLLRLTAPSEPLRLDACGMRLTRSWRHLDRGSGELADGRLLNPARVFGATGAASLFARAALLDVAIDGEVFDPAFHSFREDAELCFRLQERGWEVLYEPSAVAVHRRFTLPERRAALPAAVNYHSLKNRYLLRFYHQTGANLVLTLVPTLARELAIFAYVLTRERASLAAYLWLWRNRHSLWWRRRRIQSRRTASRWRLERWFWRVELPP